MADRETVEQVAAQRLELRSRYERLQDEVVAVLRRRKPPSLQLLRAADVAAAELAAVDAYFEEIAGLGSRS